MSTSPHIAYNDLRRALVAPDDLTPAEIRVLADRVQRAAVAYPDAHNTPAQNAENAVLRAYHGYLQAVLKERL